jgi:cytochrome c5
MKHPFLPALMSSILLIALVGCAPEATTPTDPAAPVSEADPVDVPVEGDSPGAALVSQKCSMCHTLERVESATYDAAGWGSTIERMVKSGLVISDDEKTAILQYLIQRDANR